jgi:ATP-binding cassette subfamily F protein 3
MLGKILAKDVNLLFLDEPTNHLDMESIAALTKAIQNFKGSCIIVTHSEALLRAVCDRLIIFAKDGADYFDGNYDEFLEKIGWDEEETVEKIKTTPTENKNKKENSKLRKSIIQERSKLTSPLKKEVEKLENQIMETEELLEAKQEELISASNQGDNSKVIELSSVVIKLEKEVEDKFEAMELAQNKLDNILEEYDEKLENL